MYDNSTLLDKKILKALNKKNFLVSIIIYIFSAIIIAYDVFLFCNKDFYYAVIYLICCVVMLCLATFLLISTLKINKKVENSTNHYVFGENSFSVQDSFGNFSNISYQYVFKLKKKGEYLFIYLNKVSVYPVNTACFENAEDKESFENFISTKTQKTIK